MKKQMYVGVVTVKAKAPQGYRPSVMTFKFGFVLDKKVEKVLEAIKAEHIDEVKNQLEEGNPGLQLKCSATIELTPVVGITSKYFEYKEK